MRGRRDKAGDRLTVDLDRLLLTGTELRGAVDVDDLGARLARAANDFAAAVGTIVYVQGPGRLAVAGRHGVTPSGERGELDADHELDEAFRGHGSATADRVVLPVVGAADVVGVVDVHRPGRPVDDALATVLSLLALFGGYVLDQLMGLAIDDGSLFEPSVGQAGQRATAVVASLRPGDGLLAVEFDSPEAVRAGGGDSAVQMALARLGIYLRNATRPPGDVVVRTHEHEFLVVLRDLKAPIDSIAHRLLQNWVVVNRDQPISIGAATHRGSAPMQTQELAQWALASARDLGGGRANVAPEVDVPGGGSTAPRGKEHT